MLINPLKFCKQIVQQIDHLYDREMTTNELKFCNQILQQIDGLVDRDTQGQSNISSNFSK